MQSHSAAVIVILMVDTSAAQTGEAASHQEEDSDRCLIACPYNFDPVCGGNGKDTLMFANSCFMDRYNCEERQGDDGGWSFYYRINP